MGSLPSPLSPHRLLPPIPPSSPALLSVNHPTYGTASQTICVSKSYFGSIGDCLALQNYATAFPTGPTSLLALIGYGSTSTGTINSCNVGAIQCQLSQTCSVNALKLWELTGAVR